MRRRGRAGLMVAALGGLVLMAWSPLVADFVGRPASAARAETPSGPALPLVLERAPFDWEGRPVYVLINRSSLTLTHIVIQSWEGDLLPLLYIGERPPSSVPPHPLAHPPYTLNPGCSVWFVGQEQPRPRYVINWLDQGVNSYQVVERIKFE
ncbi:hypothetical protein [Alicyclobacillus mali (ex Roth et al. 2021)]|nr:hypothetical protein [Alicyclobacillus mali (ex Roth et al. 2021)]